MYWGEHKKLCQAIRDVESRQSRESVDQMKTSFPFHLTPRQRTKLTKLVGRRCMVSCVLQGQKVDALWDTGAQVRVMSKRWEEIHLLGELERDVSELLEGEELNLQAANGTEISYDGWVEVDFQLAGDVEQSEPLKVPILVGSQDNQEYPIIGFNVIEEVIKRKDSSDTPNVLTRVVSDSFPSAVGNRAQALVNFFQTKEQEAGTGVIRVGRHDIYLAPGETVRIKCTVHFGPLEEDLPVVFEPKEEETWPERLEVRECLSRIQARSSSRIFVPVHNQTQRVITLHKRTELGTIKLVQSVTPLPVEHKEEESAKSVTDGEDTSGNREPGKHEQEQGQWVPPVDLSHLSCEQQSIVTAMLKEECSAFAVDDNDTGCARELQLEINLKDDKPVQKTYNSIPKPLYGEVKTHLQDMISHGWISKWKSPYSSPVVCIKKKDGSLRLCVYYHQLNSKTLDDR